MSQFPSITNANGLWTAKKVKRGVQGDNWPLAPAAPTIGTATAGIASASITFTAPSYVGSSAITGYLATANPGGLTGTSATSPVTISGLSWTTSYTFNVSAINSQAVGPVSAQSNSVTPNPYPPFAGVTVFGSTSGVTTGTFSVGSATSLVIYGCAGGGNGSVYSASALQQGCGAGGGGASQLTGYTISVTPGETLSYSVGGPNADTTVSRGGVVIFQLLAGSNGDNTARWGGAGGALNSYASHAGGDGGSGGGRFSDGVAGTSVVGCAGGGGGGGLGDSSPLTAGAAGGAGGTSSTTGSIFTGVAGGNGGAHSAAGTSKAYAYGGNALANFYNGGGGGAGGGITMAGAGGFYYGGGGGGAGDQNGGTVAVAKGGPGLLHIPA